MKVTKKKKVLIAEIVDEYRGFLTYMDYFATGEGRTVELNFCYADTKREALEKHGKRFYSDNADSWNYFKVGVEVLDIKKNKNKVMQILTVCIGQPDAIYKIMTEAMIEMYFKFYFNYN